MEEKQERHEERERDSPTSDKNACTSLGQDRMKRHNYYAYADAGFIDSVKKFITSQERRIEQEYGTDRFISLLVKWRKWFDEYLAESPTSVAKLLKNMPPSWSQSEPLPMATIVTEGDAGTGKTFSINTLMRSLPDGTVSAFAKKGTEAYLTYAVADTIPDGMNHVMENNTMCKMFRIKFSQERVRARLSTVLADKELEMMADTKGARDAIHAEKLTRHHFALAALKLWPLVAECNNEMLKDFLNPRRSTSAFRRTILDEKHPHYTGDDLVPALLVKQHNSLKAAFNGEACKEMSVESARHIVSKSESILEQDAYRLSVAMGRKTASDASPPPAALFPVLLFEEDGMAPSMYGDLRKILVMITQFMYLPPYMFSQIPVIVSSGSTTQSSAIGSVASALQMSSTPSHLGDKRNVLAYKAEFFRRDKNSFKANDTLACRATCMNLERCLPASDYTYASMYVHEEHSTLVDDPGFLPEGTRLYRRHKDVCEYTRKMTATGRADLPVTDLVFVADNVVEINPSCLPIPEDGLSKLSDAEAKRNRTCMWKGKNSLYKKYTKGGETECLPGVDYYSTDKACIPEVEEAITRAHHDAVTRRQREERERATREQNCLKREMPYPEGGDEMVEHCDTGATLASDQTFAETARDSVIYDNMVSENKSRKVKKKQRLPDGSVRVVDVKEGELEEMKTGLTFIVGRARDILSRGEHAAKRRHAEALAQKLGNGKELARLYLNGSKVVDQEATMTYDPTGDIVLEYARPDYDDPDVVKSVERSTNTRIMYMAFKRQRYMTKNAPVTAEKVDAKVTFCGTDCTLASLMQNDVFVTHVPVAFKAMVFAGVMDKYKQWQIGQVDEFTLMGTTDHDTLQSKYRRMADSVPPPARKLIDECDRVIEEAFAEAKQAPSSQEGHTKKREKINIKQLSQKLGRLVSQISNRPDHNEAHFLHAVRLVINADQTALYSLLKYENKPVSLAKLRLTNIGDIKLMDTGESTFNAGWRMDEEKRCTDNITCPSRYPWSLLREERNCVANRVKLTPSRILQMGIESYLHNLHIESMCTLLLTDCTVVTTKPTYSPQVSWSKVFTQPKGPSNSGYCNAPASYSKPDRFGLVLRRGMADTKTAPSELVNNMFSMNGGELMNLPRPFKSHGSSASLSNVILKTQNLVITSAKKSRLTPQGEMTSEELNACNEDELKVKRVESIMMFGSMNPMYGTPASTVAYSQGSTHQGYVLLNFNKIEKGDHLVSMTRTSDTSKLKVADVMAVAKAKEVAVVAKTREMYRKKISSMTAYYNFRQ